MYNRQGACVKNSEVIPSKKLNILIFLSERNLKRLMLGNAIQTNATIENI